MEFLESAFLIVMGFICFLGILFVNKYLTNNKEKIIEKRPNNAISDLNYKQTIKEMQEMYGIQITQLKKDRYRLQGTLNRYGKQLPIDEEEEEDEIDMTQYEFDKEMVRPMLNNWGMNADALENPMLQKIIMDKVKGNEEILITLGILKNRNHIKSQVSSNETNFISPAQALINAGQYA